MKIHETPRDTEVYLVDVQETVMFRKMDGMWAICEHPKWGVQYIAPMTEVICR